MKAFFLAIFLFILGAYADFYRYHLDKIITRRLDRYGDISSDSIIKKSEKSYKLYMRFQRYEQILKRIISPA
jgi:hypothetical protein